MSSTAEVLLDTSQVAVAGNLITDLLATGKYRIVKAEVTGIAFTAGSTPKVQLLMQEWNGGGTVAGGDINAAVAAGSTGLAYMGEGCPTQQATTNLNGVTAVFAFARPTHVKIQCNLQGSPTSATFRVRVIGFP